LRAAEMDVRRFDMRCLSMSIRTPRPDGGPRS
jgi:hypothetical protein